MSSKEKEPRPFQEKLMKQFFRFINKGGTANPRSKNDFILTEEIEKEISSDSPFNTRQKVIKELGEDVLNNKLEDKAIEKLWFCLKDLLHRDQPRESRHLAFWFLQRLLQGQYDRLGIMRAHFFRVIKQHDHIEDTNERFELLNILTFNGKDLLYFEEEVGPFLLSWMPHVTIAGKSQDYLTLLVNVIKFNASYLDEEVITGLVQNICDLSASSQQNIVLKCLQVLDTIVCYSSLPTESLPTFIAALCRTVNREEYCQNSWKIMRNLLGTHMGHSALYTMCRVLQEPACRQDQLLLRGAVFHVNQALWGIRPLASLCCTPASVLPSFLHALHCDHPIVVYEVMLSVQGLVNRCGSELHDPAWDIILDIIEGVIQHVESSTHTVNSPVATNLHETLDCMEKFVELAKFNGSTARLYELVERCSHSRPESSVLRLVNYTAESIVPTKHMWLSRLHTLIQRYFRQETRTNVRIRVLEALGNVIKLNRIRYEDELIERIVVPHLQNIASDPDVVVRNTCAELLVDLCLDCDTKRCSEILDILDKILNRPFEQSSQGDGALNDAELTDVKTVVSGLIKVFTVKLHRLPSTHFTRVYRMLVSHLENHYAKPVLFETSSHIRSNIFNCFLKIRANSSYHLGCVDASGNMRYSPYLCVLGRSGSGTGTGSPPPASPAVTQQSSAHQSCQITHVSLRYAFKVFITCLREEKDWDVLHLVLQEIPHVMQNKALVLSKQGNNEIDHLATALCAMLMDKTLGLPESLRNASKLPRAEFHSSVLLVLASLASYHAYLDPACQQRMIRCMVKFGLMPRCCSQHCITALTTCTLEMQDVMVKLLPEVLLDLSKISTTPPIAIPVLEFLSTLTHLPTVFGNFVGDQYMAVFAIALPYTNPFKFNHYTVSLAHHVIAVWFLKCRLPFRKDFVRFITTGLQTNALTPFEETAIMKNDVVYLNEDSSNRKRSSSLTEQGSRRRDRPTVDLRGVNVDRALQTFYEEITETAIDLMARYTFSPCSALPKRLPTADFLLSGGQSMSWLLGNKVITVTTSGCSQKALKQGLCDKCLVLCRDNLRTPNTSCMATRQNSSEHQHSASNTSASSPTDEVKRTPGGNEKLEQLPSKLYQLTSKDAKPTDKYLCSCWCQGWAEVHVRRPTGDMSWVMRIQNQISQHNEFPLNDISHLFMPSLVHESKDSLPTQDSSDQGDKQIDTPSNQSPSRQSSRDSVEDENDPLLYEDGTRSRNPVRRTNSSPEMSASWKNPFMTTDSKSLDEDGQKKNKNYSKDMRVSCEAIPEEISGLGTTPPSNHPNLLTCRSYPGPQQEETSLVSKSMSISSGLIQISSSQETKLPNLTVNVAPTLTSKPPQSPTQTSPRLSRNQSMERPTLALNIGAARDKTKESSRTKLSQLDSAIPPMRRDRGHTISVMSPVSKPRLENVRRNTTSGPRTIKDAPKSGINPSFVFLQLYHTAYFGNTTEKPLLVGSSQIVQRAVKILDTIPPYETHKVGVIYVGPGQCNNETEILRNGFGSVRYMEFLSKLGTLIGLQDVDPQTFFLGGLEQNGHDGKFAYIWQDDVMQVIFHVATLMPCKESDPSCNNKKLHIGNDFVTIVYNESGEEYNIGTIKGQFNYANVIIQPLDHNTNKVIVKVKEELTEFIGHNEPKIISDQNLGVLARQLALHANLASRVTISLKVQGQDPYASNWLERLRKIKQLRTKVLQEYSNNGELQPGEDSTAARSRRVQDFTEYT